MVQQLGETREAMALDVCNMAADIADGYTGEKPVYIIYAAKPDPHLRGAIVNGLVAFGGIRQTFKLSHLRPPMILGQLVWYADRKQGIFEFLPDLSSPPDLPVDPAMLSQKSEDQFSSVMQKGKEINVLVS